MSRVPIPAGTKVYIERETAHGKMRVFGVIDNYPEDHNNVVIVRTKTGRNVRISSLLVHTVGAHRT